MQSLLVFLLALHLCQGTTVNRKKPFIPEKKVSYHKRLIGDLLDHRDYRKQVRPVKDSHERMDIYVTQKLVRILDVNERGQYVAMNLWTTVSWYDEFLAWDPHDYDNIHSIVVPHDQIWLPDIIVDNSLQMNPKHSEGQSFLKLKMNLNVTTKKAQVVWTYPAIYNFTCLMDVSRFPFDTQNCSLFFSSWSYAYKDLRFEPVQDDADDTMLENEEWTILSFTENSREIPSPLGTVSMVDLRLVIRRKYIYYIVNLVIPIILMTFVSLLGFFSPSSSQAKRKEKMMLGINTLLAMSVLQLAVSDTMPISSNNIPLIGSFFVSLMVLTSVATGTTAGVINTEKGAYYGHKLPSRIKGFLKSRAGKMLGSKATPTEDINHQHDHPLTSQMSNASTTNLRRQQQKLMNTFDLLQIEMLKLQSYYSKRKASEKTSIEWQWFGNTLDRGLFIFFVCLLFSLAIMFFSYSS